MTHCLSSGPFQFALSSKDIVDGPVIPFGVGTTGSSSFTERCQRVFLRRASEAFPLDVGGFWPGKGWLGIFYLFAERTGLPGRDGRPSGSLPLCGS